ncbi:MAG: hypothetical protein V4753_12450 [Pseudomonadota bacterium]
MERTSASCCATTDGGASGRLPAWATRNRMVLAGSAVVIGGAALNWGWLSAIGVAPFLLAMAPCGVMGAVGMCSMGKKTPATTPTASPTE